METVEILSSPGAGKTTRPVPFLSKDYHTPVSELETNDFLKSTLTDETHQKLYGETKTCLF